jgi:hypothetical protein
MRVDTTGPGGSLKAMTEPQARPPTRRQRPARRVLARTCGVICAMLATLALTAGVSQADTIFGSSLTAAATYVKSATVDSVYWALAIANGNSTTAPSAGKVESVTVKGRWTGGGLPTILFQVLRHQADGSVQVIATSQPFVMPMTLGTYTFKPENMFVQAGDSIGLATIGGTFEIAGGVPGSATNDFSGHNQDMNGAIIRPTTVEKDIELLVQVDLKPLTTGGPAEEQKKKKEEEEKKKKAPCHCKALSIKLDPTLLNKSKLRADKHDFGVGFTWKLRCTEGAGGCEALAVFSPPKILAGTLPAPKKGPRLNLKVVSVKCKGPCGKSKTGHFAVKMLSRDQLNKLFGRTLAFYVVLVCPGGGPPTTVPVKVFVDQQGKLRSHR